MSTYILTLDSGEKVAVELTDRTRTEMQAVCDFEGKVFETDWFDEQDYMPRYVVESLLDRLNHHSDKVNAARAEKERQQELDRLARWNSGRPMQVSP